MANIAKLLTEHMAIWTAADTEKKSGRGRASGNTGSAYGVKKLRELILGLAISGKLLPQNNDDISTHEVSKKLALKRKILNEELLTEFQLPDTWQWFCISDLCDLKTGATPSTSVPAYYGGNIRWLVSGDIHGNEIFDCEGRITESGLSNSNCKILPKNSILIALNGQGKTRATVAMLRCEAACNQSLVAMISKYDELILPEFIWLNLKYRYTEIRDITGQNQRRGLNMGLVGDLSVSVPPLAEQHRIVAKVDELMALCDQLEQQHSNAQEAHETLVSQLLATLTQSQNAAEFNANWQRIYAYFDVLFTTEASIDTLKQTLLQLAVMGKLVPQDPSDEPASELLKRIQGEKAKLIAEGKLKKEKPLAPIGEDEKPFELPEGWEWTRYPELGEFARGKSKHRPRNDPILFNPPIYPLVQTGEVARAGYVIEEFHSKYSEIGLQQSRMWAKGTLCITIAANIADSAILGFDACFPDSVVGFSPNNIINNAKYFLYFMKTARADLLKFAPATAQKNINLEILESVLIPTPPLGEQHRIVAKVDALMVLCDQLKTRIQQANQQQQAIADVLVAQALRPHKAEVIDLAEYRKSLTCYVINAQHSNSTFGRTQAEKVLAFSQNHIGFNTELQFRRKMAGPYSGWMEVFEAEAKEKGWISVRTKQISDTKYKYEYGVNSTLTEQTIYFENNCPAQQKHELDRLLKLFENLNTEQAEIIATLFCAWNDFLIMGDLPTDDEVIREVRENWHPSKERFSPEQLTKWLNWLRENNIVPTGKGSKTIKIGHQQKLIN